MIRHATLSDVEKLSTLINNAWQENMINLVDPKAKNCLSINNFASKLEKDISTATEIVIVCELDGEIAGYASGNTIGKDFDSEIVGLYVSPNVQQRGVGSHLFSEIQSIFKSLNKSNMLVWTLLNAANNKFYLKYNPIKIVHRNIMIANIKHEGIGFVYSL